MPMFVSTTEVWTKSSSYTTHYCEFALCCHFFPLPDSTHFGGNLPDVHVNRVLCAEEEPAGGTQQRLQENSRGRSTRHEPFEITKTQEPSDTSPDPAMPLDRSSVASPCLCAILSDVQVTLSRVIRGGSSSQIRDQSIEPDLRVLFCS